MKTKAEIDEKNNDFRPEVEIRPLRACAIKNMQQ